jgi:hypothetical protein
MVTSLKRSVKARNLCVRANTVDLWELGHQFCPQWTSGPHKPWWIHGKKEQNIYFIWTPDTHRLILNSASTPHCVVFVSWLARAWPPRFQKADWTSCQSRRLIASRLYPERSTDHTFSYLSIGWFAMERVNRPNRVVPCVLQIPSETEGEAATCCIACQVPCDLR